MHPTALEHGRKFFDAYLSNTKGLTIVDIGSQDVNGSLRQFCSLENKYIGIDFANAKGVDIVLSDPYSIPLLSDSVDVCISTSCFEHSEFFWLLFNEIMRIIKPTGLFYLNAPSSGPYHQYPVDCWRFRNDAPIALKNWSRRSGYNTFLLESFVNTQNNDTWQDCVSVFIKDEKYIKNYPNRIRG